MVLPVNFRLRDGEDVVEQEAAELAYVMTFPVLNTAFQGLHGREVLSPTLRFVDLIRHTLCRRYPEFQLFDEGIVGCFYSFEE